MPGFPMPQILVLAHVLVGEPDPLRRDMRWRGCGLPLIAGSGMIAATTNAA
jgi:hypothetical protein